MLSIFPQCRFSVQVRQRLHFLLLLLLLGIVLIGCSKKQQNEPDSPTGEGSVVDVEETVDTRAVVFVTDTSEWTVQLFKEHLLYSEAVLVNLPDPWIIPTREDAAILRTLTYPYGSERFITCDGCTFGMPSASVSKAGAKTKYSVLGLYKRKTVIYIQF